MENKKAYALKTAAMMILAPLSIAVPIGLMHNLAVGAFCYHILMCLLIPFFDTAVFNRGGMKSFLSFVGITGGEARQSAIVGAIVGVAAIGITIGGLYLFQDYLLTKGSVTAAVGAWGIPKSALVWLTIYMIIFNGAAEEIFWRGYIHRRLEKMKPRILAIILASLCYVSYHIVTVAAFTGSVVLTLFFTAIIFSMGIIWGLLRDKFNNSLASIISHVLATVGYMSTIFIFGL